MLLYFTPSANQLFMPSCKHFSEQNLTVKGGVEFAFRHRAPVSGKIGCLILDGKTHNKIIKV